MNPEEPEQSVLGGISRGGLTASVLTCQRWLAVKSRIDFGILLLTYKAVGGQAPGPPRGLLSSERGTVEWKDENLALR